MDAVIALHKPQVRRPVRTEIPVPARQPGARLFIRTTPDLLVASGSRVVVVAPHPDDEVLAVGGTVATLAARGHEVLVVAVTDGEGSHPHSGTWTPERLRSIRPRETEAALARLGLDATTPVMRLHLPDGRVAAHEKALAIQLPLRPDDTVFVTWRHDGHADHEACARATLAAARNAGARCIEFPVWALVPSHRAHSRLRGRLLHRISLSREQVCAKEEAMAAFESQIAADGMRAPVLYGAALDTWRQPFEWVLA
jgi:LmbE family N-acetylglucosaminyl deacetylase